jgi:hypothetical protein
LSNGLDLGLLIGGILFGADGVDHVGRIFGAEGLIGPKLAAVLFALEDPRGVGAGDLRPPWARGASLASKPSFAS